MAEAILYGVAQTIIENLGSMVFAEIGSMWGVEDEFEKLKDTVSAVQAVLLDAEEQQVKNYQVKHWLVRLRDAVYDADDLLTEFYTEDMRLRVIGDDEMTKTVRTYQSNPITAFFTSSSQLPFCHDMAKKITAMRERFDAIANDMNKFQFVVHPSETRVVTRERGQTCSFVCEEEVIGREEDKKAIIDLLLDYDVQENVSFISIVGIGGLGKTTLAQYVFNDEKVKNYFDLRMWVSVSDVFDVKTIAEKIIRCADVSKHENLDMEQVQNKLRETLNQKKYLLVLDDVWNEDEEKWCNLKRLLIRGSKGSKVVITTRTKLVAAITSTILPSYHLKGLSENQSWSLFKQMAFRKVQEMINPNLEAIGRDIVQKCCGVPLAIKAIGRILFFKKTEDEWLYIKNKELTNVTQEENNSGILPILKLSYDHLPSHLKCCFAYCSLFPKDHEISKFSLINLWIAQGFIQLSNEKLHMEDVANDYCMDLLWRSFFQEAREDSFGNVISFKMHDLIHDLAQSISRVECTYIDSNIENVKKNVRHLSIASHNVLKKDLSSLFKAKKIRTLILITGEKESSCQKPPLEILFSSLRCLRALSLRGSDIIYVPNSIEELTYLKYLDLSRNKIRVLPISITRLLNLQTLNLSYCGKLKELPGNVQNLFNLRNLELEGCDSLTYMPPGLGQLTSLQVLPLFIVNEGLTCGGLPELNKLNNLRGELRIEIKVRVEDATSKAKAANLKDKQHLRKLVLIWDEELGNDVAGVCEDENLMEGLQPHRNLKKLKVEGYQGVRFPSWLRSLTGLVMLKISNSMCQYLSPMYQLPNLRDLSLEHMDGLEYISDREITEGISASSTFFPSLESLKLQNCPNLKGWWRRATVGVATSSQQYQQHVSFPRLLQLEIRGCKNLTCMPLFPNLEKPLRLTECSCNPLQQTMNMKAISLVPSASNSSPPLSKLKILSLSGIEDIEFLPEQWLQNLASLEELRIEKCDRLKSLSLSLFMQHLTSLKTLFISECKEVDLFCDEDTQSVGVSPQITDLEIFDLPRLVSLPEGIGNLTALQDLEIFDLPRLVSLPEGIGNLTALQDLAISDLPCLVSLPEGIGNLTALPNLRISDLPCLVSLPEGIGNLTALQDLEISDLPCLVSLPEGIGNLTALQNLEISDLPCLISLPEGIRSLTSLKRFHVRSCANLTSLPSGMHRLSSLETLIISKCPHLKERYQKGIGEIAHVPYFQYYDD
ncbi:putative disease resistance protein RGA1 isoform X9 [Quercus robur]|uniref:putative disease resistance protein RGA1 isoform X9 n=1 Tax=Quercus robur TaxID=38942 RepID=UPI00216191DF|nr:putative disease resistance protein RGA1 isoform X9 [Quercus robur]